METPYIHKGSEKLEHKHFPNLELTLVSSRDLRYSWGILLNRIIDIRAEVSQVEEPLKTEKRRLIGEWFRRFKLRASLCEIPAPLTHTKEGKPWDKKELNF